MSMSMLGLVSSECGLHMLPEAVPERFEALVSRCTECRLNEAPLTRMAAQTRNHSSVAPRRVRTLLCVLDTRG